MASGFSITFSGEILESFDRESVKASFGERFRISGAQLDKVFAAKRVVLKKGLIEGQASVFVASWRRWVCGWICVTQQGP